MTKSDRPVPWLWLWAFELADTLGAAGEISAAMAEFGI